MNLSLEPETTEQLVGLLRSLRAHRETRKGESRPRHRRPQLSRSERSTVYAKTAGRCHVCGGEVDARWQADHVLAHSGGGVHRSDNYLPAHALCNNYRWDYLPTEFQLILKLGVWARTQIERGSVLGRLVGAAFVAHENGRRRRRRVPV